MRRSRLQRHTLGVFMYELPLFPLNTVLFPGMPLPLQIFEERYKEMIDDCIREKRPFGVVLIREGVAENGPLAEPHAIGCTAQITQVQPLDDDGRMLIVSIGRERFRIVSLHKDKPYLVGIVEPAPLLAESRELLEEGVARLHPLVLEYLQIMAQAGHIEFEASQVPTDAEALIYLAAAVIQLPNEIKQSWLAIDKASELLHRLERRYSSELPLLRMMPREDQGIFSYN